MAHEPLGRELVTRSSGAILAVALASAGCGTLSAREQAAVLAAPTEQSRAELARVVSVAMNGQPVILAPDALTHDSVLLVERRTPPGPQGRIATGRTIEAPARFRLVLRGERCVLVRAADEQEWVLDGVACVPASAEG